MTLDTSESQQRFLEQLRAGLQACDVSNSHMLVALSGGPDSVALLRGLVQVRDEFALQLYVGHVNHRLRGMESDNDAQWVRELCDEFALPCHVETVDAVPGSTVGESLEEAARRMRYELLTALAVELKCETVAVAHTANDQAETVLHHMIRGTGLAGLRGMPQVRRLDETIRLVRPLLAVPKTEVETWLSSISQSVRIDATNSDTKLTRNRIRAQLLPLLAEEFNPQISRVLNTLSVQAGEIAEFIGDQAQSLSARIDVAASSNSLHIDCGPLSDQHVALVRETLRLIWQNADWPRQRMGFREWQRLAELALKGGAASLPERIDARRRGTLLVLTRQRLDSRNDTAQQ